MNALFRDKLITKTYWAVIKGNAPKEKDTFTTYLWKNEKQNKSYAFKEPRKDALLSELSYKVLKSSDNYTLLEVNPHTGRHHQIRAMLAMIGCPIKGDLKYGSPRSNPDGSIHLHARAIEFEHPVTKEMIRVEANVESVDSLWEYFADSETNNFIK
jgi:23S rRNA pseudouridine1911/1915/1917 synthase